MSKYPTELADHLELLTPGMGLGERADWELERLLSRGLIAAFGLTPYHARTTAEMSREKHIAEHCASDADRFGTLAQSRAWVGKDGGRAYTGIYAANESGAALSPTDVLQLSDDELRQVAYGWLGELKNDHIPGADITTAYRVGAAGRILARERRRGPSDDFRLGRALGQIVTADGLFVYNARPEELSLDMWGDTNPSARRLYESELGFINQTSEPGFRPTQEQLGTLINGNSVFLGTDSKGRQRQMVADVRYFDQFDADLAAAQFEDQLLRSA